MSRRSARMVLGTMSIVVLALAFGSAWNDSATIDEPAHIAAGLIKLREGRLDFYSVQPPLMNVIAAAPLALAGYRVDSSWHAMPERSWVVGRRLLYGSGYDARRILLLARLPVIAMLLVLALAAWAFVLDITGDELAALIAFALTGFCPNLLAHGRLATVDLGVTFFSFAAGALFLRLLRVPSPWVAVVCGAATGCAIASKTSGALIVVFFAIVLLFAPRRPWKQLALAAASSVALFAVVYLIIGRSHDLWMPFREFLRSAAIIRDLYATGYGLPQFLMGEFSSEGWPHYHLVAFLLKTTLPAQILALLAIIAIFRRRRFEAIACCLFVLLLLVASACSSLNLGVRHVLPIYPFLYAATAMTISDAARGRQRTIAIAVVALHAVTALAAFPSYISYFNPLIGDHRNADALLIDSNLDWGQDLHRLALWTRAQNIDSIRVHYFGGGDVGYELGPRAVEWSGPLREPLPPGWFALSRHLYRITFAPGSPLDYETYLRQSKARYITTIGGSIDVYRVGGAGFGLSSLRVFESPSLRVSESSSLRVFEPSFLQGSEFCSSATRRLGDPTTRRPSHLPDRD